MAFSSRIGMLIVVGPLRSRSVGLLSVRPPSQRSHCRPQRVGVGVTTSSAVVKCSSEEATPEKRRSATYPPSLWEDSYIQSLTTGFMEDDVAEQIDELKEYVRHLLAEPKTLVDQLQLVDHLQQLGVSYHFEKEIRDVLVTIHNTLDNGSISKIDDLYAASLLFRLLRENGFHISTDMFNNFNNVDERFDVNRVNNIKAILCFYEASFLAQRGENEMVEARKIARKYIESLMGFLVEPYLKKHVAYSLELPSHRRFERLHTRWFIDMYETKNDKDLKLLKLAKLDFNILQDIYRSELQGVLGWWKNQDIRKNLGFARDRLVENYFFALGFSFEPKYWRSRLAITKACCLITSIDDVYDVYGSLEELKLFTDAVDRWNVSRIENLPGYLKICFMVLFNTTNDIATETLELKKIDVLPYLKRAWADLCKAYLVEARWYHRRYIPSLKEYLENAWISISGNVTLTHAYCTSEDLSKENLEHFNIYSNVVRHSSMILRLYNDLATSTAEIERGDVPKSIQCYMNEKKVPEAMARKHIIEMIASAWEELNDELISMPKSVEAFKKVALNIPRMSQFFYQHGDGFRGPHGETKDQIISLIIEPIK